MPNWITNNVTFSGNEEVIERMKKEIVGGGEEQFIDFNKIAPIPKELRDTQSPLKIISQKEFNLQEKRIANDDLTKEERQWGLSRGLTQKLANEYQQKFGATNWYEWQIENWGTKWNASESVDFGDGIEFNTAWSTPYNLFVALSKKYPEVHFKIRFSDEDFGYNVGEFELQNGEELKCNIPEGGSQEAFIMAMDIQYGGVDEYFECNEEIFTEDYIDSDDEVLSSYVSTMIDIAYEFECYPTEDCEYHKLALEKFKEKALVDEKYELVSIIQKELEKVEK